MRKLKDLRIGLKIFGGFFVVLLLMLGNGYISMVRLGNIRDSVDNLANNLSVDQTIAEKILTQVLRVRFRANRYILRQEAYDLERYEYHMVNFEALLAEAEDGIQEPERVEMLNIIKNLVEEYGSTFSAITKIINTRSETQNEILEPQGEMAEFKLLTMREIAFQTGDIKTSDFAADAQTAVLLMRYNVAKFIESGEEEYITLFDESYTQLQEAFDNLDNNLDNLSQGAILSSAEIAIEEYTTAFYSLQDGFFEEASLMEKLDSLGPQIEEQVNEMTISVHEDYSSESAASILLVKNTQWFFRRCFDCSDYYRIYSGDFNDSVYHSTAEIRN